MSASRAQIRQSIARDVALKKSIEARTPVLRAQFSGRFAASEVWNQLFPKGTWHGANLAPIGGSITIDDSMLEEMVANWRAAGSPPLPVYKTHGHLDEDVSPLERAELSKAFGYLTDFRVTAQGLEAKTEWTPAGKAMVDAGEFAFWSPEWQPRHRDRRTGEVKGWWLSGTALCSDPFFNEMPPVAASADDAETTDTNPQHRSNTMNEEQLKQLRASLGLAADASVDTILKAAAETATLKASAPTADVITAAVAPVKAQVESLTAELAKRDAALLERDVEALVATAKRGDGKQGRAINDVLVATAKKLAKDSLKAAEEFLQALPLTVPLAPSGVAGEAEAPLTAATAKEKLDAIADGLIKTGTKRGLAMEEAIRANPELARVAQQLTAVNAKSA